MLELRNVTKIYRSKKGQSVKALDNVNITFAETGMVFILGKSGSGKSTLLNVIGGLDGCDSGEFIIKGKSSKNFGGSDFDAYRNTFIGFIFQEYNILDDFSVGANIGLALELQGKKATDKKIFDILSQVDMLEYATRKPNELSGGQKQRIAIARALVKDPEIIMADEPTGALDSNTGKQIFETLKELSKSKLVIVVSHDRDFAERYGDRIIEMQDGNIISDVTKHQVAAKSVSSGILQMNDNLLRIEKGYQLTEEDVRKINEYLKNQENDIIVSGDSRINNGVRSSAGIDGDNSSSVFKNTDAGKDVVTKEYKKEDSKFIRSRLPMKNALKMGGSSLGHKKFRLAITILLSLIAFALFGFADTLGSYDRVVAATDSIVDSNVTNASFSVGVKHSWMFDGKEESVYYNEATMNEDDIKALSEQTGMNFIPVFNGSMWQGGQQISIRDVMISTDKISSQSAYTGNLYGFTAATANDLQSLNFALQGKMPTTKDEIVISKLVYEQLNLTGFENTKYNEKVIPGQLTMTPGDTNSIIGKHISAELNGRNYVFVVSGVIDTGFDYQRYDAYIPKADQNSNMNQSDDVSLMDMIMQKELDNALEYGFHSLGYITQEKLDEMAEHMQQSFGISSYIGTHFNNWNIVLKLPYPTVNNEKEPIKEEMGVEDMNVANFYRIGQSSDLAALGEIKWFDGTPRTTLGDHEMIISENIFNNMSDRADVTDRVNETLKTRYEKTVNDYEIPDLYNILEIESEQSCKDYIANNFDEFKTAIEEKYKENRGPESEPTEEDLRIFWENAVRNNEEYNLPDGAKIQYNIRFEEKRLFVNEYLKKNYPVEYGESFFDDVFNRIVSSNGDGTFTVSTYELQRFLAIEYAYATVWSNNDFVSSRDFFEFVIKDRCGYESYEAWNEIEGSKKITEGAWAYAMYITDFTGDESMAIIGEKRFMDFEEDAKKLREEWSPINYEEIFAGAYLEREVYGYDGENTKDKLEGYKIVGTYSPKDPYSTDLVISDTLYKEYMDYLNENKMGIEVIAPHEMGIYSFVIAPMPTDRATIQKLVEINYNEDVGVRYMMQNQVIDSLDSFNDFIEIGSKVFLYVGIGFALFAALMLMNFISVSISYKRREIGILRAVGARSSDVFKIFFCEAAIIALINYVLSIIAAISATELVNYLIRREGINISLLHFGIRQWLLMLAISIAVAAIASFLPVWNIARRKPVDAIKNK